MGKNSLHGSELSSYYPSTPTRTQHSFQYPEGPVEYNDLYTLNEELRKKCTEIKTKILKEITASLASKMGKTTSIGSFQEPNWRNTDTTDFQEFAEGMPNKIYPSDSKVSALKTSTVDCLLKNFNSCSDCITSIKEFELSKALLEKIDSRIMEKLSNSHADPDLKSKFSVLLAGQKQVERLGHDSRELQKQIQAMEMEIAQKEESLKNSSLSSGPFQERMALRKAQLDVNRQNQIKSHQVELEYLYSNDPMSLVEDCERYQESIQQDIDRLKEETLKKEREAQNTDYRMIEIYRSLKRAKNSNIK